MLYVHHCKYRKYPSEMQDTLRSFSAMLTKFVLYLIIGAILFQYEIQSKNITSIMSLMRKDIRMQRCKFPPEDVLEQPHLVPGIQLCETRTPEYNSTGLFDSERHLCEVLYDVSLRLCSYGRNSRVQFQLPHNATELNDLLFALDKNERFTKDQFCTTVKKNLVNSTQVQTKGFVSRLNIAFQDTEKCKITCFNIMDQIHPLCKIMLWGNILFKSASQDVFDSGPSHLLNKTGNTSNVTAPLPDLIQQQAESSGSKTTADTNNNPQQDNANKPSQYDSKGLELPVPRKVEEHGGVSQTQNYSNTNTLQTDVTAIEPGFTVNQILHSKRVGVSKTEAEQDLTGLPKSPSNGEAASLDQESEPSKPEAKPVENENTQDTGSERQTKDESSPQLISPTSTVSVPDESSSTADKDEKNVETPWEGEIGPDNGANSNYTASKLDMINMDDDNQPLQKTDSQAPPPPETDYDDDDTADDGISTAMNTGKKLPQEEDITISHQNRFVEAEDSHFFAYFMAMVVLCILGYLVFHNKQKVLALAVEGWSRKDSRRRPNTAGYRKLDSNLEEAVTSACNTSVSHVIY